MHAGARLSRATIRLFRHNDVAQCAEILSNERARYQHCLVMTEGVFSMDGDRAPVKRLAEIARAHDAWLLTDDAHALGVIGAKVGCGRGSAHADDAAGTVPLQMGTLSKAVGAYGGYLCTDRDTADFIRHRARSLIYSTGLPPGTRSEEHTSELQSLMRISYAVFCLKKKTQQHITINTNDKSQCIIRARTHSI